jgi:hypothetical protein
VAEGYSSGFIELEGPPVPGIGRAVPLELVSKGESGLSLDLSFANEGRSSGIIEIGGFAKGEAYIQLSFAFDGGSSIDLKLSSSYDSGSDYEIRVTGEGDIRINLSHLSFNMRGGGSRSTLDLTSVQPLSFTFDGGSSVDLLLGAESTSFTFDGGSSVDIDMEEMHDYPLELEMGGETKMLLSFTTHNLLSFTFDGGSSVDLYLNTQLLPITFKRKGRGDDQVDLDLTVTYPALPEGLDPGETRTQGASIPARIVPANENIDIGNHPLRRSGVYVEIAPNVLRPGWSHNPRRQYMEDDDTDADIPDGPDIEGDIIGDPGPEHRGPDALAMCRMGDMRYAMATVKSIGTNKGFANKVEFRLQGGAEAYGRPRMVFNNGRRPVHTLSMVAGYDPITGAGAADMDRETALILATRVQDGSNSWLTFLYVSLDRGVTWQKVWVGDYTHMQPKLVAHPDGRIFLFYKHYTDHLLRWHATSQSPADWRPRGFEWDASGVVSGIDLNWLPYEKVYDISAAGGYWNLAVAHVNRSATPQNIADELKFQVGHKLLNEDPTGIYTETKSIGLDLGSTNAVEWLSIGRAGGNNEFGHFPKGRRVILYSLRTTGTSRLKHSVFDASTRPFTWTVENKLVPFNGSKWGIFDAKPDPAGPYNSEWREDWNVRLDQNGDEVQPLNDRETWLGIKTPSTRLQYGFDPEFGRSVRIDSKGDPPDESDPDKHDQVDSFGHWWTRSTEDESKAFPPFTPGVPMEAEFSVRFSKPLMAYHNIWFVIDDPANPETPIFRLDAHAGNDAYLPDRLPHPHDIARGMRVTFCKPILNDKRIANARLPVGHGGDADEYFQHPIPWAFEGFERRADNSAKPYLFRLTYTPADDMFRLYWRRSRAEAWLPFIPYKGYINRETGLLDEREYVDIGGSDAHPTQNRYMPHPTEKYWEQPRNGRWPRRFFIGHSGVQPAIAQQTTMWVGPLKVTGRATMEACMPVGQGAFVPRLSGGLDVFYVDRRQKRVHRLTYGYPWQDVFTAFEGRADWGVDGGPDQAEIKLLDVDNYNHTSLYGDVKGHNAMIWVKGGWRDKTGLGGLEFLDIGGWGAWTCPFFGTADTGQPLRSEEGPIITMRLFSPLRAMTRSYQTQGFMGLPWPRGREYRDEYKTPEERVREWQLVMMRDKVYAADPNLPWDAKLGMSMHNDDYIAYYVWCHMLGLDQFKLQVPRLGITPPHFTVNETGEDVDLMQDVQRMWGDLGLTWWYDFWAGGVLRASLPPTRNAEVDMEIDPRYAISLPIQMQEDDWGRAGNVVTVVDNVEARPNTASGRVAPWPDGAGTVTQSVSVAAGLPSQHGQAMMYAKGIVHRALQREWMGARALVTLMDAFPYVRPDLIIEYRDPPPELRGKWRSTRITTWWNTQELVTEMAQVSVDKPYLV